MQKLSIMLLATMLVACSAEAPKPNTDAATGAGAAPSAQASDTLAQIVGVAAEPGQAAVNADQAPPPLIIGERTLDYPTNLQMAMLAYRLRGAEPPIEAWAGEEYDVRYADEFTRPEKLRQAVGALQTAFADTAGVGFIRMRTESYLSEYDATRGGFYVNTFEPGMSFGFNDPENVSLQFGNALAAHLWPLSAAEASAAFERNGRNRRVELDIVLKITGIESRGAGTVIATTIQSYTVHGNSRAGQLGAVNLQ